jgi:hypothetical protein
MTIKANSMKHPDGEIVSPGRPALLSLNQVHHDDIPMPMPDGAAPPFAWTLQPGGATFDPPVAVEYPNMSGLAPGAAAFFLTFNHDTERFEIVASGHVVADGSKIVTDPGVGLTISGWGGNCPPYTARGGACYVSRGADCKECNSQGTIVPKADGTPCDDKDSCTLGDRCVGGACKGNPPNGVKECPTSGVPTPNYIWSENIVRTNIPGAYGYTDIPQFGVRFNNTLCFDPSLRGYFYNQEGIEVRGSVVISTFGFTEPSLGPNGNINAGNYCCVIQKLSNVPGQSAPLWHMLEAIRAHEHHHRDHDLPAILESVLGNFQNEIGDIFVSCDTPDAQTVATICGKRPRPNS